MIWVLNEDHLGLHESGCFPRKARLLGGFRSFMSFTNRPFLCLQRAANGGSDPSWLNLAFVGRPDVQSRGPQIPIFKGFWDLWTENRGAPKTPNSTTTDLTPHLRPSDACARSNNRTNSPMTLDEYLCKTIAMPTTSYSWNSPQTAAETAKESANETRVSAGGPFPLPGRVPLLCFSAVSIAVPPAPLPAPEFPRQFQQQFWGIPARGSCSCWSLASQQDDWAMGL